MEIPYASRRSATTGQKEKRQLRAEEKHTQNIGKRDVSASEHLPRKIQCPGNLIVNGKPCNPLGKA
jgi:hypothetical protein